MSLDKEDIFSYKAYINAVLFCIYMTFRHMEFHTSIRYNQS